MGDKIRVLVVDDSAFMRKALREILESDPSIVVVGTARDGEDALEKLKNLAVDVVTLDINMPRMDGLTALKHIMLENPVPVLMVSSLTQEGAEITIKALELGAVDFVPKPSGTISLDIAKCKDEIIRKTKAAARAKIGNLRRVRVGITKQVRIEPEKAAEVVVAIGVSTGGPQTLMDIIPNLPPNLPAGVLVVQHMPPNFTRSFAERLHSVSQINFKEAEDNDIIKCGWGYLAPGDWHMTVVKRGLGEGWLVKLSKQPEGTLFRPSVDVMMHSVARHLGDRAIGVILTGMGDDGARGMEEIKKKGGYTIAESGETCIVFGMPKAAIERGCVDKVLPANRIADAIVRAVSEKEGARVA